MIPDEKPKKRPWSDEDLLHMVLEEQRQAIGFENDTDLSAQRVKSLNYARGLMEDAVAPNNRSQAMASDVSDGIETVLPDLIEIFTGEDVATFRPENEQDELKAEQETDYIRHVVMEENDGFLLFYGAFKDALTVKTGVFKWWWEEYDNSTEEHFEGKTQEELMLAAQAATADPSLSITDLQEVKNPDGSSLYSFVIGTDGRGGKVCIQTVPPEDFSVARDTVRLADTTYCCMRSRPRAQDLLAMGYDAEKVAELPPYGTSSTADLVSQARDTVSEQTLTPYSADDQLRTVEIVEHFIRLVDDDGKCYLYRLVTGGTGEQGVILEVEEADHIQFSAITPYPQTHRFYGRSLADLLVEIQKIKTALLRMFLDSGYFALNQRYEVADQHANDFTYSDLIRNEPGVPVRSRLGNAVRPITAGGLNFNVTEAIEFISSMAETRTGVVRNAQGLNPDSLHETAQGAMALMGASQKRVRMIAKIFAETGVRDMFLGVHALIRTHAEKAAVFKLRGSWVPIDPTQWAERKSMTIEIGVGSGGRMQELAAMNQMMAITDKIVQGQGGFNGPLVTAENVYNQAARFVTRGLGMKSADTFFTDPKPKPGQQPPQPQQPPPDPEMVRAQMEHARAQQEAQADQQQRQMELQQKQASDQRKADQELELGHARIQSDAQIARAQLDAEMQLKRYEADQNLALQREQIAADTRVELQKAQLQAQATVMTAKRPDMDSDYVSREPGGDIGNVPRDL